MRLTQQNIDMLVRKHTAFESLEAMLNTAPDYFPTLMQRGEQQLVADAYDQAMEARGDDRRAWRGSKRTE
jgi:hypothetical protein